jgi:hypothetical protein
MSTSPLYRSTSNIMRKHSRISMIAAAAATAGALSAAGFAASTTPTAHVGSSSASGQSGTSPLATAIATVNAHHSKPVAGGQLDVFRSAGQAAGTSANATGDQTIETFAAQVADVEAAKQLAAQQAAKAQAAAQAKAAAAAKLKAAAQAKAAAQSKAFAQAKAAAAAKAKAAAAAAKARAAAAAKPYTIYDSVSPSTIPSGQAAAVYANGAYAASAAQAAGHHSVLWIDTNGSDPAANVLDVEPGDATPVGAAQWVQHRLTNQPHSVAIVYTMMSDWQQVKDNVAHLPGWMQSHVRYWIADPTGVPHVVPGSSATQWYWGSHYDVTTANPNFTN